MRKSGLYFFKMGRRRQTSPVQKLLVARASDSSKRKDRSAIRSLSGRQSCNSSSDLAWQCRSVLIKSRSRNSYKCMPSKNEISRPSRNNIFNSYCLKNSSDVIWKKNDALRSLSTFCSIAKSGSTHTALHLIERKESPFDVPISK